MSILSETIVYQDKNTELHGFMAYDENITLPAAAVLIAHPWQGRNQFVCDKATALAEQGYIGFAIDMYGEGHLGKDATENAQLMQPFIDDRSRLQQRINAALSALQKDKRVDAKRIAAIGYCFGGLCVLDLARTGAGICGVISIHGLLTAAKNIPNPVINTKVLVLHGDTDPLAPMSDITALRQELSATHADWQVHIYGNTQHAFTNPLANDADNGLMYKPIADQRAWQTIQNFLNETIGCNHKT